MLGYRIASPSEVIGAIVSGYSPCCGVPHLVVGAEASVRAQMRLHVLDIRRTTGR